MAKDIRLSGIAASWEKFRPLGSLWRQRFVMGAFSELIASGEAVWTAIRIQHLPDFDLPTCGVLLEETRAGLVASFRVRPGDDLTDDVLLALRHGYFNGLSLGFNGLRYSHGHQDRIGRFSMITKADIGEVSLVDHPLIPGTSIDFAYAARPAEITKPKSIADGRRLERFLASIGYETLHPDPWKRPKPKPAAKAPAPRPEHKPTAKEFVAVNRRLAKLGPIPLF